jgi:hypothetical protein
VEKKMSPFVNHPDFQTLQQRRNWLTARIKAKESINWEVQWDVRERDSLTWALSELERLELATRELEQKLSGK